MTPQSYRPDIVPNVIKDFGEVLIAVNASKLAHFFLLETSHGGRLASAPVGISLLCRVWIVERSVKCLNLILVTQAPAAANPRSVGTTLLP